MSIFSTQTASEITDEYIEKYGVIDIIGNSVDAIYLNGITYVDYFDVDFWQCYHMAEGFIKLGIHDLRSSSASHIKISKHITNKHIDELQEMFRKVVMEHAKVLIYKNKLYIYYKDSEERCGIRARFIIPMMKYICDIWPLCKYPIVPQYLPKK